MLDQWGLDLGNASGPFSSSDLADWSQLCGSLGVPADESASRPVLFCLQTYFALVAKLIALVILEGATGHDLVSKLLEPGKIRQALAELESGRLTAPTRAINVIEPGIFSWYLGEQSSELTDALANMVTIAGEYSAEVVEITPLVARDVMKDLFQRLLPASIRHRLGEYYTPDWLAQRVINQVTGSLRSLQPSKRILDPACGSGTFLVEVISRMVATAANRDSARTLQQILENVVGFDLSPLAVQASKVNYLLALAPLLRSAQRPIFLPVFLADSVSPPRRGDAQAALGEPADVFIFASSEGSWRVPVTLAQSHYLPELGSVLREAIEGGHDGDWVRTSLRDRLPIVEEVDESVLDEAVGLFEKLADLDRSERDGMWWHLVSNAFAPTLQGRFDFVVGNPPWVSWETLPEDYRRSNDDLWLSYRLRPDIPPDRRQASAQVRLDLSMLFVSRCIDSYLLDGGKLGFVITASVFRSELAGRGFRRRHLPPNGCYRFTHLDDMTSLSIFEGAANQTSVLVAEKRPPRTITIPVAFWRGSSQRTIPRSLELEQVRTLTVRREFSAEPADPLDEASPLLMMTRYGLEASRPLRQPSPYLQTIREGINTRGANGVFFVETLGRNGPLLRVRNLPSEGRNRDVTAWEGSVEPEVVRSLLRGFEVSAGAAAPSLGLLLFHNDAHLSSPIPAPEVRRVYPHAFNYMTNFEATLRSRRRFRNFDPTGDDWLGIYSVTTAAVAQDKVVVREIAQGMIAAPIHGREVVPDHKLHVIPCSSREEADRLARVLNSRVVQYLVLSFSMSTSITGSFLRYVGVRNLSEMKEPDDPDQSVAEALGLTLDQYRTIDSIARTELDYLRTAALETKRVGDDI
jgi:SAM-dependent methyltransferase